MKPGEWAIQPKSVNIDRRMVPSRTKLVLESANRIASRPISQSTDSLEQRPCVMIENEE